MVARVLKMSIYKILREANGFKGVADVLLTCVANVLLMCC
jgi:hypothetical protein